MDGDVLGRLRRALGVRQADVAARIPRADGAGPLRDTQLSLVESGVIEPTPAMVEQYLAAVVAAHEEKQESDCGNGER